MFQEDTVTQNCYSIVRGYNGWGGIEGRIQLPKKHQGS